MSYDIFVSVSWDNLAEVAYIRERFSDRKVYCPLEGGIVKESSDALKHSTTLIALITPGAENVIQDLRDFHQYHSSDHQQKLESIVAVVEDKKSLDRRKRDEFASKGYLEDNIEGAMDLISDYLAERDEWMWRNMYKQEVPWLKRFYTLQIFLIKALESLDKLRQ